MVFSTRVLHETKSKFVVESISKINGENGSFYPYTFQGPYARGIDVYISKLADVRAFV